MVTTMAEYIEVQESDAADQSMNLPVRRPAAASETSTGLVKQAALVADASADPVPKADYDALLQALKDAGLMASS